MKFGNPGFEDFYTLKVFVLGLNQLVLVSAVLGILFSLELLVF
jgi:hypothetical protein